MKTPLLLILFFISTSVYSEVSYSEFSDPTGKYSSNLSGICLSCSFSNTSNVADDDLSNSAQIKIAGGIVTTMSVRAKLNVASSAGTIAGFYVQVGAIVSALPSVTVKTYKNGVFQENIVTTGNLITLLGGGIGNIFGTTTKDYDEVGIFFNGGIATVSSTINVFYAFGGYTSDPNITLPVKLIDLSASQTDNKSVIKWKAEDDGNAKYELQKSNDGIIFTTIYTETSAIAGKKIFQYTDKTITGKIVYYRIRIADKNSSHILYSKTINLKLNSQSENNFRVFPNPATGNQFIIRFDNSNLKQYELQIIDETGKLINRQVLQSGSNTYSVNIHLQPGAYILKLTDATHSFVPAYSKLLIQ